MDKSRTRVHSHHMRELSRGKFIVKNSEITLLETIGEGIIQCVLEELTTVNFLHHLGEFGIVYKARQQWTKHQRGSCQDSERSHYHRNNVFSALNLLTAVYVALLIFN